MTALAVSPPLGELRAAWSALASGAFARPRMDWGAVGIDIAVAGAHGGAGATTLALALAEAAGSGHVVELAPVTRAGLVAANQAEQGSVVPGWRRGRRGGVVIDILDELDPAGQVPATGPAAGGGLTVVDLAAVGVLGGSLATGAAGEVLRQASRVVVVARASVPGMRALAVALGQIPDPHRTLVAVLGAPVKRWERPVSAALPAPLSTALEEGRLVAIPLQPALAVTGVTPDPLPQPVLAAAQHLLGLILTPLGAHDHWRVSNPVSPTSTKRPLTSAEVRGRRGYPAALRSDGHQRSRQSSRRNAGLSVLCAVARRCTAPKLTESSDATSWVGLPNMALQLIARSPTPRSATCVGWSSER